MSAETTDRYLYIMPCASWVIVSKATGKPVLETYSRKVVAAINLGAYRVVPIGEWLASLNGRARAAIAKAKGE